MRQHGETHRRDHVQLTGVSERSALRDLAELVEKGLVELSGGRGRSAAVRLTEMTRIVRRRRIGGMAKPLVGDELWVTVAPPLPRPGQRLLHVVGARQRGWPGWQEVSSHGSASSPADAMRRMFGQVLVDRTDSHGARADGEGRRA